MSSVKSVFPNGIFNWTDRVNEVNIVFANDTNSLAAEVISVENTLGENPQIEKSPPAGGNDISYTSVDARISDAMNNAQMPAVFLQKDLLQLDNVSGGILNTYDVAYDPFGMHNGIDVTVPVFGWWIVDTFQTWGYWNDGYVHHMFAIDGLNNIVSEDLVDWEFSGNIALKTPNSVNLNNITGGTTTPVSQVNPGGLPRWLQYGKRSRITRTFWQGLAYKGQRFSVYSENGTSNSAYPLLNIGLRAVMVQHPYGTNQLTF